MNIESTNTATISKQTDTTSSSSAASSTASDKSFKDELNATKTQENTQAQKAKETTDAQSAENAQNAETVQNEQNQATQKNAQNNLVKQAEKDKLSAQKEATKQEEALNTELENPLNALTAKIATINQLKNNTDLKSQSSSEKTDKTSKDDCFASLSMNNNDIKFFVNLVDNQQMTAQISKEVGQQNNNFTEVKTEAAHQPVQVSSALLDALNQSYQTNKPFRIDFDSDIAVIMKVDKNGTISANFIPGSSAVEQYLRNNISTLQQNFDNQNLPYNELSYSKREQQEKQNQNKENENE